MAGLPDEAGAEEDDQRACDEAGAEDGRRLAMRDGAEDDRRACEEVGLHSGAAAEDDPEGNF